MRLNVILRILPLIILFVCRIAAAQETGVGHGTIIIYVQTVGQTVIVADSKFHSPDDSTFDYIACKIVQLSRDTLFFYTGNLAEHLDQNHKLIWSQAQFAKDAYKSFEKTPTSDQRLMDMAEKYFEVARPTLDSVIQTCPMLTLKMR